MYMRFKDGKIKAVTLSYDDGVVQDKRLMEILDRYGLKATFNINSGLYSPENEECANRLHMKLSEAKALYINSGHEVAVHGFTHSFLEKLSSDEVITEIMEDRKRIEEDYKTLVRGMAYPFGTYSDKVIEILRLCKIAYARTVESTERFEMPCDWLRLNPTCHHDNPRLNELAARFLDENNPWSRCVKMFYLWGHSYEFDRNNNWNVIEDFAKTMGGHDDIWYATNIEIYDYVQAYNNLYISVDKKIIYNPSYIDVWVLEDDEVILVKAGQYVYR